MYKFLVVGGNCSFYVSTCVPVATDEIKEVGRNGAVPWLRPKHCVIASYQLPRP